MENKSKGQSYWEEFEKTRDISSNSWYTEYARAPGEKSRRVVTSSYAQGAGKRTPSIDWALVKEIQNLINTFSTEFISVVTTHLEDALNEDLSEDIRMYHVDIALSRIWTAHHTFHVQSKYFPQLVQMFHRAGAM
jgi:hypothetical protein